jgi:hypothetical protein
MGYILINLDRLVLLVGWGADFERSDNEGRHTYSTGEKLKALKASNLCIIVSN